MDIWTQPDLQVNDFLMNVYKNSEIERNNKKYKFIDVTDPLEGKYLYDLIKENKIKLSLEIGLAMGTSAVYMCQGHKDIKYGKHFAIDPNQKSQYDDIGLYMIEKCKLKKYLTFIEEKSYIALPGLLRKYKGQFDLIYIDGWHTFDYTLIDFFYSDKLLKVGGLIVIDDVKHKPVKKCVYYILSNYKHFKMIDPVKFYNNIATQVTFIKLSEDTRSWNFHINF